MNFWTGLMVGWVIGSVSTGLVMSFFIGVGRNNDRLDKELEEEREEERLKGRRE